MAGNGLAVVAASAILSACSIGGLRGAGLGGAPDLNATQSGTNLAALRSTMASDHVVIGRPGTHAFNVFHPKKKKIPLLYVSDILNGTVEVYDFLTGIEVGSATGFNNPYGECSDKAGDAYVADFGAGTVTSFKYGSTKGTIVASGLKDPIGCSVDERGDLAVSQYGAGRHGEGSVVIYKAGSKTGTAYNGPYLTWPPSFDTKGDLFVEGERGSCGKGICVSELPAGGTAFATVRLRGATIEFPGSVELNQGKLEFGDQNYKGKHTTAIYSASCSGSTCTVTATTNLTDTCTNEHYDDTTQWAEYSNEPNLQSQGNVTKVAGSNIDCDIRFNVWDFPRGRNPIGHIGGPREAGGETLVE
ncbi:MAG TPA: hypothetical protein VME66_04370 [Candidatus Acidoferrales bacterium]|nr:hypothetical protein [Candidatus Acidoferrales bacterium]